MSADPMMPTGNVSFDAIRRKGYAYVDKTGLLTGLCDEVGKSASSVHVYTHPARFGKTLNLSMIERFFDVRYAGEPDVFDGLEISEHHEFDRLRNRLPVIRVDMRSIDPKDGESVHGSLHALASMAYQEAADKYGSEWMGRGTSRTFDRFIDNEITDA